MKMKIWNMLRLKNNVWKRRKAGKIHTKITYFRGMWIRWPGSLMLKNLTAAFAERMAVGMLPFLLLPAKLRILSENMRLSIRDEKLT